MSDDWNTKPRRLQSATILSIVTRSVSPAAAVSCASVATSRTLEPAPERPPKVRIRTPSWRAVTLGKFPLIPHLYEGEAADGCCTLDPGRSNGHRRFETHQPRRRV